MSIASRQSTCAACGTVLGADVDLEVLIDDTVRWIAVHPGHATVRTDEETRATARGGAPHAAWAA